jgi:hypothetical protein
VVLFPLLLQSHSYPHLRALFCPALFQAPAAHPQPQSVIPQNLQPRHRQHRQSPRFLFLGVSVLAVFLSLLLLRFHLLLKHYKNFLIIYYMTRKRKDLIIEKYILRVLFSFFITFIIR